MNRRALLTAAGPIALAAAIPATAALAPEPVPFVHPDAAILDQFARWAAQSWRMAASGLSDEAADAINDEVNAAARAAVAAPAVTLEGFAVQVLIMLHPVYGGRPDDPVAPDWPAPEESIAEADLLRPLVERVMQVTAAVRAPWMAAA